MKGLKFKLDLRITVFNDEEVIVDGLAGEVAKTAIKSKLYTDKLKSILATKCHINNFLKNVPHITTAEVKKLRFPIIQIMGMDVHVYVLGIPCRSIYVVNAECCFSFPSSNKLLRSQLERLVDCLSHVEALLDQLAYIHQASQNDPNDAMKRVAEESPRKKKFNSKPWTSEVFFNGQYDIFEEQLEKEEEDDDQEDEDDE